MYARKRIELPTDTEVTLMQLLQDNASGMYGLEIVEASKGALKRGSIYVLLGRLVDKGFVKSSIGKNAPNHPGLPRPTYRLTADGIRVLSVAEEFGLIQGT